MTRTATIKSKLAAMRALTGRDHAGRRLLAAEFLDRPRFRSEADQARIARLLAALDNPSGSGAVVDLVSKLRGMTASTKVIEAKLVALESHQNAEIAASATRLLERFYLDEGSIKARIDVEMLKDPTAIDPDKLHRLLRRAEEFDDLDA